MYIRFLFIALISQLVFSQSEITHKVYFDTDEYIIKLSEKKRFDTFLSKLDSVSISKITIHGYCDDRGTVPYNQTLSENRANAVKLYLVDNEISEGLVHVLDGKGELALNKNGDVSSARKNNRRVDVLVKTGQADETNELEVPTTQEILRGEIKEGDKIRLKNIYFKTGYSIVISESVPVLKEIADILIERENVYFTIQGHVCCTHDIHDAVDRKTGKRNLSIARAKFIYNFLARRGVSKHRMKYIGLKRKFPLGGDPRFDRRVEILITYISDKD